MKTSLYILAFLLGITLTLVVMVHLRLNWITHTLRDLGAQVQQTTKSPKQGH